MDVYWDAKAVEQQQGLSSLEEAVVVVKEHGNDAKEVGMTVAVYLTEKEEAKRYGMTLEQLLVYREEANKHVNGTGRISSLEADSDGGKINIDGDPELVGKGARFESASDMLTPGTACSLKVVKLGGYLIVGVSDTNGGEARVDLKDGSVRFEGGLSPDIRGTHICCHLSVARATCMCTLYDPFDWPCGRAPRTKGDLQQLKAF